MEQNKNQKVWKLAQAGIIAALAFVAFMYLQIPITTGDGGRTFLHIGNVFPALGALMLGGVWGGLAGGIGMALADVLSGSPVYAVTTIPLKLIIGVVTGLVAHRVFKINTRTDKKQIFYMSLISCIIGLGVNIITDPIVGYLRNRYIFGMQVDLSYISAKISAWVTSVNALACMAITVMTYNVLRPALVRSGLLKLKTN